MSPSRFAKSLMRGLRVTWRENPTQYDIEALEENIRRVGLVIRFRWMIVTALAAFSVAAAGIYVVDGSIPQHILTANMAIPAFALVFVLAYNTYYQITYRFLGNIAILNHAQLLFDSIVITVLVHYSGGAYSWFYPMYALIVLEAAFIFPKPRDTWLVAAFATFSYAAALLTELFGLVPHVSMPLIGGGLESTPAYAGVRIMWVVAVLGGTALVSLQMMQRVNQREAELSAGLTNDSTTGLPNRTYFRRKLGVEIDRAHCYRQSLALLMLDIDDFAAFNHRFGLKSGNRMLREIGGLLKHEVCECPGVMTPLNTVSRYGGEEFAVILPHPPGMSAEEAVRDAAAVAAHLCTSVGELRVDDMGVTVSGGLVIYPLDGTTAEDLLASADQALFAAASAGGNRIGSADEPDVAGVAY